MASFCDLWYLSYDDISCSPTYFILLIESTWNMQTSKDSDPSLTSIREIWKPDNRNTNAIRFSKVRLSSILMMGWVLTAIQVKTDRDTSQDKQKHIKNMLFTCDHLIQKYKDIDQDTNKEIFLRQEKEKLSTYHQQLYMDTKDLHPIDSPDLKQALEDQSNILDNLVCIDFVEEYFEVER